MRLTFKTTRILWGPTLLAFLVFVAFRPKDPGKVWRSSKEPLAELAQLRKVIKEPIFKHQDYLLTAFGALGDGKTMNTEAFKKAIEQCNRDGGGRVIVPKGVYLTGAIYLKSHVNLHFEEGARVLFSRDVKDYPIVFTRWEGMECMNYSSLFYAYGEKNIAITGKGYIDGNADQDNWWSWCGSPRFGWSEGKASQRAGRNLLHELNKKQVNPKDRVFGEGYFLRPNMVQFYKCENVLISDVEMTNSPMWFLNPVLCENVIVRKIRIVSHGPNNDGCDPESCKNVLIQDCYFDTGDDCLAIKSGRDQDGRRIGRPAENHIIERCEMKDGHGGVVIGSEISGGARNIYAIDCIMDSPNLDRVLRLKTSSSRGGIIENIFMMDVKVGTYKDAAVTCNMFYENPGDFLPTIRNVWVENLDVAKGGQYGLFIKAYKASPVQNLTMVNCTIRGVKEPMKIDYYKDLKLQQVTINGKQVSLSGN
ncbi:glycoside hydrolase family 28 protein [Pedobacter sp. AW31-3R]|uniref:glycoside hydrolase family 28 protein n=1 Tax=Pedobacter sp. AW31-3R TaxID=3445781 RepID=UPI003F9FA084